jgi:hypothetical protein
LFIKIKISTSIYDMSRAYVFTWNNYDDKAIETLDNLDCSYLVYGKEVGASGTPHLQGYVEFEKQKKFNTVRLLLLGAHIELRLGTAEQAADYCKKDGNVTERGNIRICRPGKRTDIDNARTMVKAGGMRLLTKKVQSIQALQIAKCYLEYNEPARSWLPEVTWIWGESGLGKSTLAKSMMPTDVYIKNTASKWFCGYDGHENVILDDFRDSWWCITDMLSLLDSSERRVEVKNSSRQFLARRIIVTSVFPPDQCYENCRNEPKIQLLRRITKILPLTSAEPELTKPEPEIIYNSDIITITSHATDAHTETPNCAHNNNKLAVSSAQIGRDTHTIFDNIDNSDIPEFPSTDSA